MSVQESRAAVQAMSEAVRRAFAEGQEDETLEPFVRVDADGRAVGRIGAGDAVIFYDVRGEREVSLTRAMTDPAWPHFPVRSLDLAFVTLIEYGPSLGVRTAFPPESRLRNTLTEVMARAGFRVRKISESEKASHLSFFFNGKSDEVFPGEERMVVASPDVAQFAERPEMNAARVTEGTLAWLADDGPQLIIANLANVDEVGHLENREAVCRAVETVDKALATIVEAARRAEATLLVTADHGTVEEWLYPDGTVNTGHTRNPVPFLALDFGSPGAGDWNVRPAGELADVAPTVLDLAGVAKPAEMTGRSLVSGRPAGAGRRTKLVLLILDGWGQREERHGNMIVEAGAPNFARLWEEFPHSTLAAAGEPVGMPEGTVGNSEAGHLHLGAGRQVLLERLRVDRAIADGSFFRNEAFCWAFDEARRKRKSVHLMGIVSHYSSHGTIDHLFALLRLAKRQGLERVFIHSFIGRRNELPESGAYYIEKVEELCRELGLGQVVTVMGRYWPLARAGHWDRIGKAYRALVEGEGRAVGGPEIAAGRENGNPDDLKAV
jgi:2,3-bisphosphoglycerate-independent phosphoglycerate mutase